MVTIINYIALLTTALIFTFIVNLSLLKVAKLI